METPSLRPELEFELFKLILLRESYLKRLLRKLKGGKKAVDLSLVGLIDILRETSLQIIEQTKAWERSQLDYPNVKPFKWNGQNYLEKMLSDMDFLDDHKDCISWLGFSVINNHLYINAIILNLLMAMSHD